MRLFGAAQPPVAAPAAFSRHTDEVLQALGYSGAERERLRATGATPAR
jgi:crotonobetainyl-CoA:carnitine CoA-transferase CaiB-like acyl-CoA transferase